MKQMKKYMALVFLGILVLGVSRLVSAETDSRSLLSFYVAQFRFNNDSTLVELNYGLLPRFTARKAKQPFVLELDVTCGDSLTLRNLWKVTPPVSQDTNATNQMIVDNLRFLLAPGRYDFKLLSKQMGTSGSIDSAFVRGLKIRRFAAGRTELSDPVLARKIEPDRGNGRFARHGFRVIPNPLGVFDAQNPVLYYYLEIYNLPSKSEKVYFLKREVLAADGVPVSALPVYVKKKIIRGRDDLEVGQIRVAGLQTGRYQLRFAVLDSARAQLARSEVSFVVQNPAAPAERLPLETRPRMENSVIAGLSPKNVTMLVGATRYFLPEEEQSVLDNLRDVTAKRRFLFQFWNDKGGQPGLEIFRQFVRRVSYANAKFGEPKKAGWQTDRGRVFILYGKPSEIQYYANMPGFREFQAWSYDNIEHGVVFIFGVTGSFGDLKLIHSTKTGEIHNEAWLDLLKVTAGRTGLTEMAPGISQREAIRAMFRRYNLTIPRFLLK